MQQDLNLFETMAIGFANKRQHYMYTVCAKPPLTVMWIRLCRYGLLIVCLYVH